MQFNLTELLAQYGITGSLLFVMLYWLVKHYLPEHQRQHREELERIIACHDRNTNRMVQSLERNTRVVHCNSQVLLVQSFCERGLKRAEAEQLVRRLQLSTLDPDGLGGRPGGCGAGVAHDAGRLGGMSGGVGNAKA
jgi:hypothetical protein